MRAKSSPSKAPIARGTRYCPHHHKAMLAKGAAKSEAKRSAKRTGTNIEAYLCPHCAAWHVGTRRKFA